MSEKYFGFHIRNTLGYHTSRLKTYILTAYGFTICIIVSSMLWSLPSRFLTQLWNEFLRPSCMLLYCPSHPS